MSVYVLLNRAGVGVGIPLGAYSTLDRAWKAADEVGMDGYCKVEEFTVDAPADYAGGETHFYPRGDVG